MNDDKLYGPPMTSGIWSGVADWDRSLSDHLTVEPNDYPTKAGELIATAAVLGGPSVKRYQTKLLVERPLLQLVRNMLTAWDGRLVFEDFALTGRFGEAWVWPRGAVSFSWDVQGALDFFDDESVSEQPTYTRFEILLVTDLQEHVDIISSMVQENKTVRITTPPPAGKVYIVAPDNVGGYELMPVGTAGEELIRTNYTSDVLAEFDKALHDLTSSEPRGRLTVLDGQPGTGKTYMVRAFMHAASEAKFLVIPPQMLEKLNDPHMMMAIFQDSRIVGRSIVLVLEDADQCLSKRKAKNMSAISSILNFTDGILGKLFDLRVIASTNTPATEFDAALLRKGRLSSHIRVGVLDEETAKNVWQGLAGPKLPYPDNLDADVTLAELYAAYNELSEIDRALGDIAKLGN